MINNYTNNNNYRRDHTRVSHSIENNQVQIKIQMQSKEQLQNQKLTNFTMATVLSTGEHLVWRLCKEDSKCLEFLRDEYSKLNGHIDGRLIFNHYNSYNSGNEKSISSLVNQFIFQIENFSDDYEDFKSRYTTYSFPVNMQKSEILNIINIWCLALGYNEETKPYLHYFENLKKIFNNIPIISFEDQVRAQYKGNLRSGKANPSVIMAEYGKAVNYIESQTKDIDNQKIEIWKK